MISIRHILVATDFGETSTAAVQRAIQLSEAFQAQLDVLHVVEEPYGYLGNIHGYLPEVDAFLATLNDAARTQLHQVMSPEEVERRKVHLALRTGTPYVEIVRYAKDQDVDLIVLGTHGRGSVRHMLLGSVAEKVVRYAHCAVLTTPHPSAEPAGN